MAHGYCCYVPQAIICIGVKKRISTKWANGVFAMIEQNVSFKSLLVYNFSTFAKVSCGTLFK